MRKVKDNQYWYIIKDVYASLKKRNQFGLFIRTCPPLKYSPNFNIPSSISIGDKITLNILDLFNKKSLIENSFFRNLNVLVEILQASRTSYYLPNRIRGYSILNYYIEDKINEFNDSQYKKIPNNMVYGFKYGTIFTICGTIAMFILMNLFLPIWIILSILIIFFLILIFLN